MEHRSLGHCGLKVSALSFGTGTFGGVGEFFGKWGSVGVDQARSLVDICLDSGINCFDTADVYSEGAAEQILGRAIGGRRDRVLISTKATFPTGPTPNEVGSSRHHLLRAVENSLRRLGTDYIDVYFMHGFDALTPPEETLRTLDDLIRAGKIRYIGCSNFSGWHVMKSLAVSERYGWPRYVSYQGCYSLISREYEWELMPLALDQGLGTMVWSPLGWGRLTGIIGRDRAGRERRIVNGGAVGGPHVDDDRLRRVLDALAAVAAETGRTVPQVALNWLLQRPSVASVIVGARNESQLRDNLGAVGWSLTREQIDTLDAASRCRPSYPYWHQHSFSQRNPSPTPW